MNKTLKLLEKTLSILSGQINGFYLAGGTPLSIYHFHHRESYDLDFFTADYSKKQIEKVTSILSNAFKVKPELEEEQNKTDKARYQIYQIVVGGSSLKIDFVEDVFPLIKPLMNINGIPVLSMEDIYIRKIYATCGINEKIDLSGKQVFKGGRQEAKDYFDLYFLSTTFMPLSEFAMKYCSQTQIESIIVWYRTYGRLEIKSGLADIITNKKIDFYHTEHHFKSEIEQLIRKL